MKRTSDTLDIACEKADVRVVAGWNDRDQRKRRAASGACSTAP